MYEEDRRTLDQVIAEHAQWGPPRPPAPWEDRVHFLALALCGEAGELANQVKKQWRGDGDAQAVIARRTKMEAELVDVANYAFLLASVLGISPTRLVARMERKLREVEGRPEWKAAHP